MLAREMRTAQKGVRANAAEEAPRNADTNKKAIAVELATVVS